MKFDRMFVVMLSVAVSSPAYATVEQCRSIGSAKERLACFDKKARPVPENSPRAPVTNESAGSTSVDPVDALKAENDRVSARLKGICRGC